MTLHSEDLTQSGDIKRATRRHIRELEALMKRLADRIEALEREREDGKDG